MKSVATLLAIVMFTAVGCGTFSATVPVRGTDRDVKVTGFLVGDSAMCVNYPEPYVVTGQSPEQEEPDVVTGQSPEQEEPDNTDFCPRPTVKVRGGHMGEDFGRMIHALGSIVGAVFGGTRANDP